MDHYDPSRVIQASSYISARLSQFRCSATAPPFVPRVMEVHLRAANAVASVRHCLRLDMEIDFFRLELTRERGRERETCRFRHPARVCAS